MHNIEKILFVVNPFAGGRLMPAGDEAGCESQQDDDAHVKQLLHGVVMADIIMRETKPQRILDV